MVQLLQYSTLIDTQVKCLRPDTLVSIETKKPSKISLGGLFSRSELRSYWLAAGQLGAVIFDVVTDVIFERVIRRET